MQYKVGDEVFIKGEVVEVMNDVPYPVRVRLGSDNGGLVFTNDEVCYADKIVKTYEMGLNDAWKLADKVYEMRNQQRYDVFGTESLAKVMDLSPQEALAKIEAYEKGKSEIKVGDVVELLRFGTKASVLAINKDGSYQLQAGIMKVNAKKDEVVLLEETQQQVKKIIERSKREFRNTPTATELDLRGMSADEAIATLSVFLDSAMLANLSSVRIIHGKGTGILRKAVHEELKHNRAVKRYRLGVYGEGEDGVTIAELS